MERRDPGLGHDLDRADVESADEVHAHASRVERLAHELSAAVSAMDDWQHGTGADAETDVTVREPQIDVDEEAAPGPSGTGALERVRREARTSALEEIEATTSTELALAWEEVATLARRWALSVKRRDAAVRRARAGWEAEATEGQAQAVAAVRAELNTAHAEAMAAVQAELAEANTAHEGAMAVVQAGLAEANTAHEGAMAALQAELAGLRDTLARQERDLAEVQRAREAEAGQAVQRHAEALDDAARRSHQELARVRADAVQERKRALEAARASWEAEAADTLSRAVDEVRLALAETHDKAMSAAEVELRQLRDVVLRLERDLQSTRDARDEAERQAAQERAGALRDTALREADALEQAARAHQHALAQLQAQLQEDAARERESALAAARAAWEAEAAAREGTAAAESSERLQATAAEAREREQAAAAVRAEQEAAHASAMAEARAELEDLREALARQERNFRDARNAREAEVSRVAQLHSDALDLAARKNHEELARFRAEALHEREQGLDLARAAWKAEADGRLAGEMRRTRDALLRPLEEELSQLHLLIDSGATRAVARKWPMTSTRQAKELALAVERLAKTLATMVGDPVKGVGGPFEP